MTLRVDYLCLDKIELLDKRYQALFVGKDQRHVTELIKKNIDNELTFLQS